MDERTGAKKNIAFIVELFMLFGIMLLVIVVITETFVMTRSRSLEAQHLTEAVIAAENTMEVVMAKGISEEAEEVTFSGEGESGEVYRVTTVRNDEEERTGRFSEYEVKVFLKGEEEPIYTLSSGSYEKDQETEEAGGSVRGSGMTGGKKS